MITHLVHEKISILVEIALRSSHRNGTTYWDLESAISWGSKQQATIALSSCEAEIIAASRASQEIVYVRALFKELGFEPAAPTDLNGDNQAARQTAYNPTNHERMKHVKRRHLYVRECIENGELVVPYVPSSANLADFFTKPLKPAPFFEMRDKIMNVST